MIRLLAAGLQTKTMTQNLPFGSNTGLNGRKAKNYLLPPKNLCQRGCLNVIYQFLWLPQLGTMAI